MKMRIPRQPHSGGVSKHQKVRKQNSLVASKKSRPKSGPSKDPQNIMPEVWYYECGRHLEFVVRVGNMLGDNTLPISNQCVQFRVPLGMLERSLARAPRDKRIGRVILK